MGMAAYTLITKDKNKKNKLMIQTSLGPLKENEFWQSRFEPFFTIPYSKCWEATSAEQYRFSPPEQELYVRASNECKDMSKDKWYIVYGRVNMGIIRKGLTELPAPPKGFSILKVLNLNNRVAYFYGNSLGGWTVNFKCRGVYFDLEKIQFDYFAPGPQAPDKDRDVPEEFKSFIASIKCDED